MSVTELFSNIVWPSDCVYNVVAQDGSSVKGGADVEHHYVRNGVRNTWIDRYRVKECLSAYATEALTRYCDS